MIIGLAIGPGVAMINTSSCRSPQLAARTYIELIRNTPLLVQLFIVFFWLPSAGIKLAANDAALTGGNPLSITP